jgi:hypothetical protein
MEGSVPYLQSPPLARRELRSADEAARDVNASTEQRIDERPTRLSIRSLQPSNFNEEEVAVDRPPVVGRIFRTLPKFSIAVLTGVGAAFCWQFYGDAAREMVAEKAPTLAWWLPGSTVKPAATETSVDVVQQLKPLTFTLDVMRRSVDQLAAKQEQIAQNIAALQAVEEDVRQKVTSTPPSPALQPPSVSQSRPSRPRVLPRAVQVSQPQRPTTAGLSR